VLVAATLLEHEEFGMIDAARNECIAAIEADETYRDAWAFRGAAELLLGENDAAGESLTRAKELDPTFGYTRYQLGLLAAARGDFAGAPRAAASGGAWLQRARSAGASPSADGWRLTVRTCRRSTRRFPTESMLHEAFWLNLPMRTTPKKLRKLQLALRRTPAALATGLVALAAYCSTTRSPCAPRQSRLADAALAVGHPVLAYRRCRESPDDLDRGPRLEQAQIALGGVARQY
jgi:tetratricopeptide (TPR) repeat protein